MEAHIIKKANELISEKGEFNALRHCELQIENTESDSTAYYWDKVSLAIQALY